MNDERIQTLVGIPPKELDLLRRKAAAFDAMVKYKLTADVFSGTYRVYDRFHRRVSEFHTTPLEAVEAAVKRLETD